MSAGIKFGRVDVSQTYKNIIIVASGPSVKQIELNRLRNLKNTFIIAVNGSGDFVPFADAWFTLDPWGLDGPQLPKNFSGRLYAAVPQDFGTKFARIEQYRKIPKADITYLHRLISHNYTNITSETAYVEGLSEDNGCISTGNSGYGALNVAYHMRPFNIFLLGLDGDLGYWYSSTKSNRPLTYLPKMMDSAKSQLDNASINVYNVSQTSAINTFKKISPEEFYLKLNEN